MTAPTSLGVITRTFTGPIASDCFSKSGGMSSRILEMSTGNSFVNWESLRCGESCIFRTEPQFSDTRSLEPDLGSRICLESEVVLFGSPVLFQGSVVERLAGAPQPVTPAWISELYPRTFWSPTSRRWRTVEPGAVPWRVPRTHTGKCRMSPYTARLTIDPTAFACWMGRAFGTLRGLLVLQ